MALNLCWSLHLDAFILSQLPESPHKDISLEIEPTLVRNVEFFCLNALKGIRVLIWLCKYCVHIVHQLIQSIQGCMHITFISYLQMEGERIKI